MMETAPWPFQALIFDLDGTLIDSLPDAHVSLNRALAAAGRREITLEEAKGMVGWGGRVLVEKALAKTGRPGTADEIGRCLEDFITRYSEYPATLTTVYPGVRQALEEFQAAGIAMGLCTNKSLATTMPVLEALLLDGFFTVVSCGDKVPHPKPDGRHVLGIIERLGVRAQATAMVGDSENDIDAARDAGISSVAVTFGYAHVPPRELGADALIDDFHGLPDALRQIGSTGQ